MNIKLEEIIESYEEYMNRIPQGCKKIVEFFYENNISSALEALADFSEGLLWIVNIESYLEQNKILMACEEEIKDFLKEINTGLELKDYVLVSDLIEYEIMPFFENKILNRN